MNLCFCFANEEIEDMIQHSTDLHESVPLLCIAKEDMEGIILLGTDLLNSV
jgi:hypothetical protein